MPETPSDPEKRDDLPKPALDFLPRVRRLLEAKKQPSDHDLDSMKARVRKALNDLLSQSGLDDYDQKSHEIILQVID